MESIPELLQRLQIWALVLTYVANMMTRLQYTEKKKKKVLIYKEIQKGAAASAKSYMTNGLLMYD